MVNKKEKIKKKKVPTKKLSGSRKISGSVGARKVLAKKTATIETQKKFKIQRQRSSGLTVDVYSISGKVVSKLSLPKEIFGVRVNERLIAQAVRVYLANQRKGTASTKTRGEVRGSTRKIWRQKGTGRARHGSRKAPIFVGGGIAFGPKPRDYSLKLPKKMKKAALFSALSLKKNNGEIKVLSGIEKIKPKTKNMGLLIKKLGFNDKKRSLLLVTPDKQNSGFENVYRAARNIEGLKILKADLLNTYDVLDNKGVLLMKDAVLAIGKHFLKGGGN